MNRTRAISSEIRAVQAVMRPGGLVDWQHQVWHTPVLSAPGRLYFFHGHVAARNDVMHRYSHFVTTASTHSASAPGSRSNRPAHLQAAESALGSSVEVAQRLMREMTGRYFTPMDVAKSLLSHIVTHLMHTDTGAVKVCDPFAGDGRLVFWLIEEAANRGITVSWDVELWDIDTTALAEVTAKANELSSELKISIEVRVKELDALTNAPAFFGQFDVVVTNPPWETLKPDSRKLRLLGTGAAEEYVRGLRAYDAAVSELYPHARAGRRFAGWGTNLARIGAELSIRLTRQGGITGIVAPGSLLADEISEPFRRWLLNSSSLQHVSYYPAESRAFEAADVAAVTIVVAPGQDNQEVAPLISIYEKDFTLKEEGRATLTREFLTSNAYSIPISFGLVSCTLLNKFTPLPSFGDLEDGSDTGLWGGRELDETRVSDFLQTDGDPQFIRGRMIDRFEVRQKPTESVRKPGWLAPPSVQHERIVWRDVSRHNQRRRVIATLVPEGWIAGNSLGVAYFKDGDPARLRWLLGIMSSLVFEIQLRGVLATGHVSLGSVRKVHVPIHGRSHKLDQMLVNLVDCRLRGDETAEPKIEAVAAQLYQLREPEMLETITQFPKLDELERDIIMRHFRMSSL